MVASEKSWLLELELMIDSSADASVRQPPLFWVLKTLDFHYCLSGSPQCHEVQRAFLLAVGWCLTVLIALF